MQAYLGRASAHFYIRPPFCIQQLWRIGAKIFAEGVGVKWEKWAKGEGEGKKKYALFFSPPQPHPASAQPSTGQETVTIQDGGIEPIYQAIASRSERTPALQSNSRQSMLEILSCRCLGNDNRTQTLIEFDIRTY